MVHTKKLKRLQPKNQLVQIKWVDSQTNNMWIDQKEAALTPPLELDAGGFLVAWTDDYIAITSLQSLEHKQVCAKTVFPIGCILEVKEVK